MVSRRPSWSVRSWRAGMARRRGRSCVVAYSERTDRRKVFADADRTTDIDGLRMEQKGGIGSSDHAPIESDTKEFGAGFDRRQLPQVRNFGSTCRVMMSHNPFLKIFPVGLANRQIQYGLVHFRSDLAPWWGGRPARSDAKIHRVRPVAAAQADDRGRDAVRPPGPRLTRRFAKMIRPALLAISNRDALAHQWQGPGSVGRPRPRLQLAATTSCALGPSGSDHSHPVTNRMLGPPTLSALGGLSVAACPYWPSARSATIRMPERPIWADIERRAGLASPSPDGSCGT